MEKDNISVVIINHNNERFLPICLASVFKNTPSEVIVVDDASSDKSIQIIENYPIKLIKNKKIFGPVKSRNIGASFAKNEYLLFLDSDTELSKNYIENLCSFLDNNKKAGVVSGKIIENGKRRWFNFGYDPSRIRDKIGNCFNSLLKNSDNKFLFFIANPFTLNFAEDKARKVDWVTENAFMTRRKVFNRLNGFDENFFMFFEGPDYCRRVRKLRYGIFYLPSVVAKHLGGHSHEDKRNDIFNNSRKYYFEKWS